MDNMVFNSIRFKNGSTAANDNYVGSPGSLSIDSELKNIRIHDGVTPGGIFSIDANVALTKLQMKAMISETLSEIVVDDTALLTAIHTVITDGMANYLQTVNIEDALENVVSAYDFSAAVAEQLMTSNNVGGIAINRIVTKENIDTVDLSNNLSIINLLTTGSLTQADVMTMLANYNFSNNYDFSGLETTVLDINATVENLSTNVVNMDAAISNNTSLITSVAESMGSVSQKAIDNSIAVSQIETAVAAIQTQLETAGVSNITAEDIQAALNNATSIGGKQVNQLATLSDIADAIINATVVGGVDLSTVASDSDLTTLESNLQAYVDTYVTDYVSVALAPDSEPTGIGIEPPVIISPVNGSTSAAYVLTIQLADPIVTNVTHAQTLVQVSTDQSFTNIVYNSGWVDNALQIVTTQSTFIVEDKTTYYIQAWFKTSAGDISAGSSVTQWTYDTVSSVSTFFQSSISYARYFSSGQDRSFRFKYPIDDTAPGLAIVMGKNANSCFFPTGPANANNDMRVFFDSGSSTRLTYVVSYGVNRLTATMMYYSTTVHENYDHLFLNFTTDNIHFTAQALPSNFGNSHVQLEHGLPGKPDLVLYHMLEHTTTGPMFLVNTGSDIRQFLQSSTSAAYDLAAHPDTFTDTHVTLSPYALDGVSSFNTPYYKYGDIDHPWAMYCFREGDGTQMRVGTYMGTNDILSLDFGWPVSTLIMGAVDRTNGIVIFDQKLDMLFDSPFYKPSYTVFSYITSLTLNVSMKFLATGIELSGDNVFNTTDNVYFYIAIRGEMGQTYIPTISSMPDISLLSDATAIINRRGTGVDSTEVNLNWDLTQESMFAYFMDDHTYRTLPSQYISLDGDFKTVANTAISGYDYPGSKDTAPNLEGVTTNGFLLTADEYYNSTFFDGTWYAFRRSVGHMDIVRYKGNGDQVHKIEHNLQAEPSVILIIYTSTVIYRYKDVITGKWDTCSLSSSSSSTVIGEANLGDATLCDATHAWVGQGYDNSISSSYTNANGYDYIAVIFSDKVAKGIRIPQNAETVTVPTTDRPRLTVFFDRYWQGTTYLEELNEDGTQRLNTKLLFSNTNTDRVSLTDEITHHKYNFDGTNLTIPVANPTEGVTNYLNRETVRADSANPLIWFNFG